MNEVEREMLAELRMLRDEIREMRALLEPTTLVADKVRRYRSGDKSAFKGGVR